MSPQPYFTIETAKGGYRAHFYGANHQLVWWTEVYTTKEGAKKAIAFCKAFAASAGVADRAQAA
jgi:uncharacterized protein YegP (UPF0339 family)